MIQAQLNFDIAWQIQDALEQHAHKLEIFSDLLCYAEKYSLIRDNPEQELGWFIQNWLADLTCIIEKAIAKARRDPDYVLHRSKEILNLIEQGARPSTFGDIDEITEKLVAMPKVYGDNFSEAKGLLQSLLEALKNGS